ncbi:hypothetical protein COV20_05035 [Candidatus Woesearchaeota archaeon CG10_big_fil_rev_8_21_14_0_10_45_16]|nr:MAG: hypothetical protein COV20_05035 [Candidatus Woesearchaeota archaeon CG10_big_fil_rev_8_21_14_0_10_45_16]
MGNEIIEEAVENLTALMEDSDISKKCKEKVEKIIEILHSDVNLSVEKALDALEEMSSSDISSYHRTQIWGIISILETAKN